MLPDFVLDHTYRSKEVGASKCYYFFQGWPSLSVPIGPGATLEIRGPYSSKVMVSFLKKWSASVDVPDVRVAVGK